MGRHLKYKTTQELESAINYYFRRCDSNQEEFISKDGETFTKTVPVPYTVEGICEVLGITRQTLLNYEKAEGYEIFFDTIEKAKAKVLTNTMERALSGKNNAAVAIFSLVNNYGYKNANHKETTEDDKNININIQYPLDK
jgi:hypothetical protein